MMSKNDIPAVVQDFNVYRGGNKLVGVSGEVTLPDISFMTATMTGAGIAGEIDVPIIGHTGSIQVEIPFRVLYDDSFSLLTLNGEQLTLRGNIITKDPSSGRKTNQSMRIVIGGEPKGVNLGKIAKSSTMDGNNGIEVDYLKIEIDGQEKLELDKLNYIFKVNGEDLLEEVRKNI